MDGSSKGASLKQDIGAQRSDDDPARSSSQSSPMPRRRAVGREATALALAAGGTATGTLLAFTLIDGSPSARILAVAIAFLAGALAAWRLTGGDLVRALASRRDLVAECDRLRRDREVLEDRLWELKEAEERHRSVLDTLGDVVIRRRDTGEVTYLNDAAMRIFPADVAPVVGRPLPLPLSAAAAPDADGRFADLLLETVDGPRWFSRIDANARDPDGRPVLQTILRDVTERRAAEEGLVAARNIAENANAAKSRFLAMVSHEIRTPLNGILGMARLLRDTRLSAEQRSYADAVLSSGEVLLLLIDEVLDFSKVEAGRLDLSPAPTDIRALVEGVVELLAPRAQAKGLEIAGRIQAAVPLQVVVDGTRLRQVLFNLAGNGLKFTETGGVAIEVEARQGPDDGSVELDIAVRDTGIGFSPEEADRLFREFEQIDHGPARRYGGTGLGLAISQRLVALMGGAVTASAAPGAGAVFRVVLPVTVAGAKSPVRTKAAISGKQVVLVSSGKIEAPLLAAQLLEAGLRADICAPGDPRLTDLLAVSDLVLLDHGSVADAAGWLAAARVAGLAAPAGVLLTPNERDRLPRLREAGFDSYLVRPVRGASLMRIVTALLDPHRPSAVWDEIEDSAQDEAAAANQASRPLRVLVAEDNDINRLLTEALLRKLGHEPAVVADGEQALEAAATGPFDAVLMDLHMPGIDGTATIARLRELECRLDWPRTPIIAVTADIMSDAHDRALAAGADLVLTKPPHPERLKHTLMRLV